MIEKQRKKWPTLNTGDKVGAWTLISRTTVSRITRWLCQCDCGTSREVIEMALKKGASTSCGCLRAGLMRTHRLSHGMSDSSEFAIWRTMKARCYNQNYHCFNHYGGRGIKVCERWLDSFQNFFQDMGVRPSKDHTLDRINVNGDYEPENCRWATWDEQQNNRRNTIYVEFNGERIAVALLERRLKMNKNTLKGRLLRGWTIEEATSIPLRQRRSKHNPTT